MSALKIIPLGGLGEIGMNCMLLEYENEILVVDCGLLFSDLDQFGVEFMIPDFTYLKARKEKLSAFLVTHGHEDHIGALVFAWKAGIHAPIYASHFTSLLIRERLKEYGLEDRVEVRIFRMGDRLSFRHFQVQTVSVNHSIVDSAAFFIETPVGRIVHTGDFKIDPTPFYGSKIDMDVFAQAGDEGTLLLLSDSTNVEKHTHSLSESVLYQRFEELFSESQGLTVVSMFASNVGRLGQIFELASKLDKKIALAGRSMEQNMRLGMEAGYLKGAQVISLADVQHYPRKQVIVVSTGSQGESRSALIRMASGSHPHVRIESGDLVLMSSKLIPGNEKPISRMINQLFRQGASVLYDSVDEIHASGHATRAELKEMLEEVKPRYFIPIHGEYRHLVHHAALAREIGIPSDRVILAVNGDILELTQESCRIVDHLEEARVLIEGRDGKDVSKLLLRDRRQMGEKGMVFSLLVRNCQTGKVILGPEIFCRGLIHEKKQPELLKKARRVVQDTLSRYGSPSQEVDLQENIRVALRRFFHRAIGRKPVVLSTVLDL
jgi:ribonuclease J